MSTIIRGLMVLVLVRLATGVWFVATSGNDVGLAKESPAPVDANSAVAPVPVDPIDPVGKSIFQCFSVFGGAPHFKTARLKTDNFGGDIVVITEMALMCEQATKTTPTGLFGQFDGAVIMACYRMSRGTNPDDPVELTTGNFGPDRVDVIQAIAMCEGASKTISGTEPVGIPGDHVWEIFRILNGHDPSAPVTLNTRNSGPDDVVVRDAFVMFEEATKQTADAAEILGVDSGRVWECYRLDGGATPDITVTLTTRNFGDESVIVGPSILMCEEATKQPILVPDDPPVD